MAILKQLSVFLENKPGVLARLCDSFAENKINIRAISVADAIDHAVVRLVVNTPDRAIHLLEERGVLVVETDVLELKLGNKPGALGRVAEKLSKAKVNIEYAYGTSTAQGKSSTLIMRLSNTKKGQKVLSGR